MGMTLKSPGFYQKAKSGITFSQQTPNSCREPRCIPIQPYLLSFQLNYNQKLCFVEQKNDIFDNCEKSEFIVIPSPSSYLECAALVALFNQLHIDIRRQPIVAAWIAGPEVSILTDHLEQVILIY